MKPPQVKTEEAKNESRFLFRYFSLRNMKRRPAHQGLDGLFFLRTQKLSVFLSHFVKEVKFKIVGKIILNLLKIIWPCKT